jgi:hypothetical protein
MNAFKALVIYYIVLLETRIKIEDLKSKIISRKEFF